MKKRILSLLLCVAMLLTLLPQTALFVSAATSGTCGDNLRWSYNSSMYTLTITGTGAMTNWSNSSSVPWDFYSSSIRSVSLPDGLTSIGSSAFSRCTGLTAITIPDSVTSIGNQAFYYCTGLTSITIGNGVTSIGYRAFYNCTGLTAITIPDSVTSIGEWAFEGCTGLTEVHISDIAAWCGISFGDYCANPLLYAEKLYLNDTLITDLVIPSGVTSIGEFAFAYCTGLTAISIPDSVTSIGDRAFYDCTGLTAISIPDSVTSIGWCAFYGCTGLTAISIPDSVTSIDDGVFYDCTGLTAISIPDSVTSIGDGVFAGCTGLTSITVAEGNPAYDSRNNCNAIIKTATNTLIAGCKNTVIPDSVTGIGYEAFYKCTGLTAISIPDSVTYIGYEAFYGCTGLSHIHFLGSKPSIESDAFSSCASDLTLCYLPRMTGWENYTTYPAEEWDCTATPNCTSITYTCNTCGDAYTVMGEYHDWSLTETITAPTCTEAGSGVYTCALCGRTETKTVPAAGHNYVDGVCSVCGGEKSDSSEVVIYYPYTGKVVTTESYIYRNYSTGATKYELLIANASLVDGEVECSTENVARFTLLDNGDGTVTFRTSDGRYLYADGTDVKLVSSQSDYTKYVLEEADGGVYIRCATATYTDETGTFTQYLEVYSGYFTVYGINTSYAHLYTFGLYPVAAPCAHANTEIRDAIAATCVEPGFTGDTYCVDCGEKLANGTQIAALGHDFGNDNVCDICGITALEFINELPADGEYAMIYCCGDGYSNVLGYDIVEGNAAPWQVSLNSDGSGLTEIPEGAAIVRFVRNEDGTYYFMLGNKYLVLKDLDSSHKEKLALCDTAEFGAKWSIIDDQAGMPNAYNIVNTEYKYNGTYDVYLEQYNNRQYYGYTYSSSISNGFQFRFVRTPADADGRAGDLAEPGLLPEAGNDYAIYCAAVDSQNHAFGPQTETASGKQGFSCVNVTIQNDEISKNDIRKGALIFTANTVTENGITYYTFQTGSKWLGMNANYTDYSTGKLINDEALLLKDTCSDYCKWELVQGDGGWLMKNKAAQYKGSSNYIELLNDAFEGYTYINTNPQLFTMRFAIVCAHEWEKTSETAATCTAAGKIVYTCKLCNRTKTEPIPATGHNYVDGVCTNCGKAQPSASDLVAIFYPKGSKVMTTESTTSIYSGVERYELLSASASLVDGKIVCTAENVALFNRKENSDGTITFATADGKFLYADGTDLKIINTEGEFTKFVIEEADGGVYIRCATATYTDETGVFQQYLDYHHGCFNVFGMNDNGGYTFVLAPVAPKCEHEWEEGKQTKEPTCTEAGETTYTCSLCGKTKTEEIPMNPHSYRGTVTTYPTASQDGEQTYTCTVCGETYTDTLSLAGQDDSLKIKRANLLLESDISICFYVLDSVLEGWETPYMEFSKAYYDNAGNITGYQKEIVTDYELVTTEDGLKCHMFRFKGICASEMSSAVTATLYAGKDGEIYKGKTVNYSVLSYATNMLGKSTDAKLKTMLVDLLNYGAASQSYVNYNLGNLANASLTAEQKAYATQQTPALSSCKKLVKNDGATVSFKTCNLVLKEKVTVNFYLNLAAYTGSLDDLQVVISYTGTNGIAKQVTIDSSELAAEQISGGTYYGVNFDQLNALQMRTELTAEVFSKSSGERISDTVTYSIESYAYSKRDDFDDTLVDMLNAMMKYGDSAEAYFLRTK